MSDQVIPENVVARIRKLLALAGNNSNENEAASAASKAQDIMRDYNLTLAELGEGSPGQAPDADATRTRMDTGIAAARDWCNSLMAAIAKNNFCAHWTSMAVSRRADGTGKLRNRSRHNLIGRQANVTVTIETYKYLVGAMERLCPYTDARDRSSISWFTGCADRLVVRLDRQRADSEAASRTRRQEPGRGNGSSIVLADVYSSEEDLNRDMRYGYPAGTTATRRREQEAADRAAMAAYVRTPVVVPVHREPTAAERAAAEKQARADARWYAGYQRRQEKAAARIDQYAYGQGSAAGYEIGLDKQVEGSKKVQRLG